MGRLKMGWHQFWGSIPLQGKSLLKNDLSWILSKVFSYLFSLIFVALFSKIAYLVYHAHLCFLMSPMTIMNTIAWPFYWWERFGWLARRLHTISRSGLEKWFILILVQFLEIFFFFFLKKRWVIIWADLISMFYMSVLIITLKISTRGTVCRAAPKL